MDQLRQNVQQDYQQVKTKELESGPKASYGYGGKFGVQKDRMDKVHTYGCIISLGRNLMHKLLEFYCVMCLYEQF